MDNTLCSTKPRRVRGIALLMLAASIGAAACGSPMATEADPRDDPDSPTAIAYPTPVLNRHNGMEVSATVTRDGSIESLTEMKRTGDFIAVAKVQSEVLIKVDPRDAEMWSTIRSAEIGSVLWQAPTSHPAPETVQFIGSGWMRNNDTNEVWALIPEFGPRLDVGDTFLALFSYSDSKRVNLQTGDTLVLNWITGGPTSALIRDERIVVSGTAADFMRKFDGLTVEDFAEALQAAPDG